jgi:hypothetical protein
MPMRDQLHALSRLSLSPRNKTSGAAYANSQLELTANGRVGVGAVIVEEDAGSLTAILSIARDYRPHTSPDHEAKDLRAEW